MAQESWKRGQDDTACQQPEGPILCVNNCGFFGSKSTMGMCSKCYRDSAQGKEECMNKDGGRFESGFDMSPAGTRVQEPSSPLPAPQLQLPRPDPASSAATMAVVSKEPQKAGGVNRCFSCRKRVGLTGFKCKCENLFCSLHRHSDQHVCAYDYKTAGRDAIARANPVIKAEKLDKM